MDISAILQPISIAIEGVILLFGIALVYRKGRRYGWFVALTFIIYVLYDFIRFLSIRISGDILSILFFIASVSMFAAIWLIYQEK
jgi:hypothetical protein